MDLETKRLDAKILSFIKKYGVGKAPEPEFNRLALMLFDYQFKRNTVYRRWCLSEGVAPQTVSSWRLIPALPVDAFKRFKVTSFPAHKAAKVFLTSGTSSRASARSDRGAHYFESLLLYETAISEPFFRHVLQGKTNWKFFFLTPSPKEAPQSSLSFMMGVVGKVFGRGRGRFYVQEGQPDYDRLMNDLRAANQKVLLLTTAFALKGFLDFLEKKNTVLKLWNGSRLMETGGFKGKVKAISKKELYALCQNRLHVPIRSIVSEYGMTELSSQYYDGKAPAWLRTVVVDPLTGKETAPGKAGLLRHVDLANRGSVAFIETQDMGRFVRGELELLGRATNSELRGCSLAFEEFMNR